MASKQKKTKITNEMSLYLRFLHQEGSVSVKELCRRYPKYAVRSIYRHAKKKISIKMPVDGRHSNAGRPTKMTIHDERHLLRRVKQLHSANIAFTVPTLRKDAGLQHVSTRTVNRYLNKNDYNYVQTRKKGLLSAKDKKKRVQFAKKVKKTLPDNFWRDSIAFYFDGVSFAHKTNPYNDARATKTMTWRKPNEGLHFTSRGKKEGNGGRMAHFFVAISYSKGTVLCKQYHESLTGEMFAEFIKTYFPQTFERCKDPTVKTFLQDGDPRQVSRSARTAMEEIGCRMFSIPARSPDLNPIDHMFHLVRKNLQRDALTKRIEKETFEEFSQRVKNTIKEFPAAILDKTINSLPKRITKVITTKGDRTKY